MTDTPSGFVILHFGSMDPRVMSKASRLVGDKAVIDPGAARMAGASFAFGDADLLDALKARLGPGVLEETRREHEGLNPEAVAWLATGERGLSSEAMFSRFTGIPMGGKNYDGVLPCDPADFRRCRLLIEQVPCFANRISEMSGVSPAWARIAASWDDLCATMDAEAPGWRESGGHAPQTYDMMKRVIEGAGPCPE